jgi:hypothetical protein
MAMAGVPSIDESWALAMLLGPGSGVAGLSAELPKYRSRHDQQGRLATAILACHIIARDTESANEAFALEAWNAAKDAGSAPLALAYRGLAAAFVASKKGASGGAFLDDFEASFAAIRNSGAHWLVRYWKGVTYLRTAKGIKDNFMANLIYGSRADAWIAAGKADLDALKAAYASASLPKGAYSPSTYDATLAPVPFEIASDAASAPYHEW